MARLSNEAIRNMSLNEADRYTNDHPAEAWRFAKIQGKSAVEQTKKAVRYGYESRILYRSDEAMESRPFARLPLLYTEPRPD